MCLPGKQNLFLQKNNFEVSHEVKSGFIFLKKTPQLKLPVGKWWSLRLMSMKFYEISKNASNPEFAFNKICKGSQTLLKLTNFYHECMQYQIELESIILGLVFKLNFSGKSYVNEMSFRIFINNTLRNIFWPKLWCSYFPFWVT